MRDLKNASRRASFFLNLGVDANILSDDFAQPVEVPVELLMNGCSAPCSNVYNYCVRHITPRIRIATLVCLASMGGTWGCGNGPEFLQQPPIDDIALVDGIVRQRTDALLMPTAAEPTHPIVLVHGMAGFKPLAHLIDYFYRVRITVMGQGYSIFATQTDPFQTIEYRARQLAVQVDQVLQETGAAKVHLLAHSQGGLDARYLISSMGYGDRVASLTTVASPHRGVKIVDMALRLRPAWVARMGRIVNALSDGFLGGKADLVANLEVLTTPYIQETFNPENPDDPRVEYYSYSGRTQANPFVNPQSIDIVNPLLLASHQFIKLTEGDNDGLVSIDSARWGTYLGAVPADHWDEIGQPPNVPHLSFNHLSFYTSITRFLQRDGAPPIF